MGHRIANANALRQERAWCMSHSKEQNEWGKSKILDQAVNRDLITKGDVGYQATVRTSGLTLKVMERHWRVFTRSVRTVYRLILKRSLQMLG